VPFRCRIGFRPTLASGAVDQQHNGGESKPGCSITWVPYRSGGAGRRRQMLLEEGARTADRRASGGAHIRDVWLEVLPWPEVQERQLLHEDPNHGHRHDTVQGNEGHTADR